MADIDIYTLMMKRIALAIQNLVDGFAQVEQFRAEHKIDTALSDAKVAMPVEFEKRDYELFLTLKTEIDGLKTLNKTLIEKYGNWDQKEFVDPLDMLGKVFWHAGDPIREKI